MLTTFRFSLKNVSQKTYMHLKKYIKINIKLFSVGSYKVFIIFKFDVIGI